MRFEVILMQYLKQNKFFYMKIRLLKKFKKSYKKLSEKTHNKFKNKISIFQNNPFEKSLNNHKLT